MSAMKKTSMKKSQRSQASDHVWTKAVRNGSEIDTKRMSRSVVRSQQNRNLEVGIRRQRRETEMS